MTGFNRGDVVIVDLGMSSKVRPCVVVSIPTVDSQRNMSIVVPMTTEIRNDANEVAFPKPTWLRQESVINLLGIAGVDNAKIQRRIAPMPPDVMRKIDEKLARILGLATPPIYSAPS